MHHFHAFLHEFFCYLSQQIWFCIILYINTTHVILCKYRPSAGEIQGAYQIKVTTTALALLLSTRHVELAKINVQGHLVKVWHIFIFCIFEITLV